MITIWKYFPTFCEVDEEDLERTECETADDVLNVPFVKKNTHDLYLYGSKAEDAVMPCGSFNGDKPITYRGVLFSLEGNCHLGRFSLVCDTFEEFKEVTEKLGVKYKYWGGESEKCN